MGEEPGVLVIGVSPEGDVGSVQDGLQASANAIRRSLAEQLWLRLTLSWNMNEVEYSFRRCSGISSLRAIASALSSSISLRTVARSSDRFHLSAQSSSPTRLREPYVHVIQGQFRSSVMTRWDLLTAPMTSSMAENVIMQS